MLFVDANIVLRYVLNDHPQLSRRAADILEEQTVVVPTEVVCEVLCTSESVSYQPSGNSHQTERAGSGIADHV
jgi:predicted nucleic acid-binding protein